MEEVNTGLVTVGGLVLVLAGLILLLRRLPALPALRPLLGQPRGLPATLFVGWFGPIGVAALYYASLAQRRAGAEEAWVVGSLLIRSSVAVHGLTATPFIRLYGRCRREHEPARGTRPRRRAWRCCAGRGCGVRSPLGPAYSSLLGR